ncbi:hypothetical protein DL769_005754 [Monosporascus sp. CRB-8-3]|nr:hypothetical protein DL769_005754 [Monosporascus sp. CRB-8-3]
MARLKTFHAFSLLPPELRQAIWEYALPDSKKPSVHIFGARLGHTEQNQLETTNSARRMSLSRPTNVQFFTPSVPWVERTDWTDTHLSSYLTDSALWFTCRESREVAQRCLKGGNYTFFNADVQTGMRVDRRPYAINRSLDLLIMRPLDLDIARPPMDQTMRCASHINRLPGLLPTPGGGGIKLGIEYDPDDLACAGPNWYFFAESLLDAVHEVACVEGAGRFYLIDKTLKLRDPDVDLEKVRGPPDFECSGRRYYEVRGNADVDFMLDSSPLELLFSLRNDWDLLTAKNLFTRPGISKGRLQATTGILACVEARPSASAVPRRYSTGCVVQ